MKSDKDSLRKRVGKEHVKSEHNIKPKCAHIRKIQDKYLHIYILYTGTGAV